MAPAAATDLGPIEGPEEISRKIEQINVSYTALHEAYEENFWATKMGLKVGSRELRESERARERESERETRRSRRVRFSPSLTHPSLFHLTPLPPPPLTPPPQGNSPEQLSATKTALESFLANPANLDEVETAAKAEGLSDEQRRTLECLRAAFLVSQLPAEASALRAELNELEAALASDRGGMRLGYEDSKGQFVEASTVQLRQVLRASADEREREAAWKGLRSIGPHVAEKFAEIVRKRNAMARAVSSENEVTFLFFPLL